MNPVSSRAYNEIACIHVCASISISSILFCILYVTNLALWLQDINKLTYLLTCKELFLRGFRKRMRT